MTFHVTFRRWHLPRITREREIFGADLKLMTREEASSLSDYADALAKLERRTADELVDEAHAALLRKQHRDGTLGFK